ISLAPPTSPGWAWEMITYFTFAGSKASFLKPPTMTSSASYSKVVSIRMIPSGVVSAQDDRSLVPTKYTSSKTFAGSVYQLLRSDGGGPGFTSGVGALRGATQSAPSKPGKSNPAAFLAAARWPSIASEAGCAPADVRLELPRPQARMRHDVSSQTPRYS